MSLPVEDLDWMFAEAGGVLATRGADSAHGFLRRGDDTVGEVMGAPVVFYRFSYAAARLPGLGKFEVLLIGGDTYRVIDFERGTSDPGTRAVYLEAA